MIPETLRSVTEELPWRLRQDIEGYVHSVSAAATEIFAEVGVEISDTLNERFLFLVGIRRIWTVVNGSYWLLDNSLSLGERSEVTSYQVGSSLQHRGSRLHETLRVLRDDLEAYLVDQQIGHVAEARSPREVLENLLERNSDEWT